MPLDDAPLAVLAAALRHPTVVAHYQAKIVSVPGSDCRWWSGAVSGRGDGRFYVVEYRRSEDEGVAESLHDHRRRRRRTRKTWASAAAVLLPGTRGAGRHFFQHRADRPQVVAQVMRETGIDALDEERSAL